MLVLLPVWFIVEDIYLALSDCAALHPDEEFLAEQAALEEDDDTYYTNPSDETELNEVQQAALRHLESVFEQPAPNGIYHPDKNHQFEDAMDDDQWLLLRIYRVNFWIFSLFNKHQCPF